MIWFIVPNCQTRWLGESHILIGEMWPCPEISGKGPKMMYFERETTTTRFNKIQCERQG